MNLDKFTLNGKFLMLALDHRGSFKKLINPQNPEVVTDDTVIQLKSEIIKALENQFSGLLIDEVWGLEACKEVCQVKPFLLPIEKSGYTLRQDSGQAGERITELEYSVKQIMDMGASGTKLLIYFNPNVASAQVQLETARKVMEDCQKHDSPYFLELVTYEDQKLTSHMSSGNTDLVIQSVTMFLDKGIIPSVWKLEYPGSIDACRELTNLVGEIPWVLLTGGESYEEFKPKLEEAVRGGAKGFLAGRALWQEVGQLEGEEKQKFLTQILLERFRALSEIAKLS